MYVCYTPILYRKKLILKLDILIYEQEYYNLLRKILVSIRLNLY